MTEIEDELRDRWLLAQVKRPQKTKEITDEDYNKMLLEGR